jgi:hypothetical protein
MNVQPNSNFIIDLAFSINDVSMCKTIIDRFMFYACSDDTSIHHPASITLLLGVLSLYHPGHHPSSSAGLACKSISKCMGLCVVVMGVIFIFTTPGGNKDCVRY